MTLKLYMDVHIPNLITLALRKRGVDVITAQEDGFGQAPDPELLDRATELDRILFTQDADFLRLAAMRVELSQHYTGIIFARQRGDLLKKYLEDLELIAEAGTPEEFAGRVQYLPL